MKNVARRFVAQPKLVVVFLAFYAFQKRKGKKRDSITKANQALRSVRVWYTSVFRFYFILIRVLNERTTLRIAVCGGLRRTRLGQLVFCLLERRRAKPERSPSSSSDVQGTTPRDDVACINSWSGPFRCSYNRMFNVSSYIRASGNSTWKKKESIFHYIYNFKKLIRNRPYYLTLPLYASYLWCKQSSDSRLLPPYDHVRKMSNSKSHSSQ